MEALQAPSFCSFRTTSHVDAFAIDEDIFLDYVFYFD